MQSELLLITLVDIHKQILGKSGINMLLHKEFVHHLGNYYEICDSVLA
ncbi:hypothetical protein AWF13_15025 [Escherichia coli]|uniref:Uncharacterized protein n=1 Tax=Escherichia coli TaxID=562 RepID=A0A1M0SLF7_ECOLX|nr:hypothetical protein ECNG_03477 [Escherichia coli TA280]EIH15090.1 hypothetical protein EC990741_0908 [Escherichia coli 97.0259]KUU04266.1 hypothetical protein AWF13_15025 [Escherichia coli]OSK88550.1 hypothetical protein ECYG_01197 [Escherichia coli B367]KUU65761.1 hypothetical protein AWF27_03505 [Escherichia coli]